MVGQHYDNIWIYYKDVTQKYNADNRLENGISKDNLKLSRSGDVLLYMIIKRKEKILKHSNVMLKDISVTEVPIQEDDEQQEEDCEECR